MFINGKKIPPNVNIRISHCDKLGLDPEGWYEWRFSMDKSHEQESTVENMQESQA